MKRILFTLILTFTLLQSGFSQEAGSRYKGHAETGYTIGIEGGYRAMSRFEVLTSHGIQFNPYLFLGAGTGVQVFLDSSSTDAVIPVFVDLRANFTKTRFIPFFAIKTGYSFVASSDFSTLGWYISPGFGVKYMFTNKLGVNVNIGYSAQLYTEYSQNIDGVHIKFGFEF